MKRSRRFSMRMLGVMMAAFALAFVVACGDDDDDAASGEAVGAETSASEGQASSSEVDRDATLRVAYSTGVNSFDPHMTPSYSGDQIYQRQIYDRLFTLARDDDGAVVLEPRLATGYEVSDDGLSITLTLREGVTFQDGAPFDADVVKANLERAIGPDSNVASLLASVDSVEVEDELTATIHLSQPDPSVPWLMATNTTGMMASPDAFDSLETDPVGTGPYTLTSFQKDGDVVYERWDDHWDADAALAKRVVLTTMADLNARYNAVRSGDMEAAYVGTPIDHESRSLESEGYHWEQVLSPLNIGILMNSDLAPLDDVRVRRAIYMAFDRQELTDELLNGINPPVFQPFAEGYLGHDPDLEQDPYDLDAARDLIEEAGATGATITLIQQMSQPQDQLAVVAQQVLGDIGLNVELVPISSTEARPTWRQGGHQMFIAPLIAQVDPGSTLSVSYLGDDNPATPPPELVQMTEDAARLPAGSDEQAEAYQEISAWLVENPVHAPLVQWSTVMIARPEVVGSENFLVTGIADLNFRNVGVAP